MDGGLAQDLAGLELRRQSSATGQKLLQKIRVTRGVSNHLCETLISKKLQQSVSHKLFDLTSTKALQDRQECY